MVKSRISILSAMALSLVSCSSNASSQSLETNSKVQLLAQQAGINPKVIKLALIAYNKAHNMGLTAKSTLTVIDYSLADNQKRLWVIDLKKNRVLFNTLVAHGKTSGSLYARHFSNQGGSLATSLGLFITENTYYGSKGYSLRLNGLDKGYNDHAYQRAIVMHGAQYVNEALASSRGQIGHSWGCPSLPVNMSKPVINTIKNGTVIFAYGNDYSWLSHSQFLKA